MLTFEQADQLQEHYRASDEETLRLIGGVTVAAFVGPTAAGKNFYMERLDYPQAGTLTNRGPRKSDINYRYLATGEMLGLAEQGKLVQYAAVQPDRLYGSDALCYKPGVNVMDVTSVAAETLYFQGFGAVRPIGVLAREGDWRRRLDVRFKDMDSDQIESRLDEAEESIDAITHSWGDERLVIVTSERLQAANLKDIGNYIETGEARKRALTKKVGHDLLSVLPDIRDYYLKKTA